MFKNLKQKLGESLENSPARSLLQAAQGKPVSRRGQFHLISSLLYNSIG